MFAEKIGESCSTTGTGTFSLGGAYGAFRTWGTGFSSGDLAWYYATNDAGSIWELGYGTYTAASPNTLSRTLVASSTGSLINWTTTPYRIYSVPSATILKHMLAPFINGVANVPAWFIRGVTWLDYALGITTAWVKRRYVSGTVTSAGSHVDEGRFYIGLDSGATHIFAASQRMVFVDKGAASYTFTADDIGKCLCFDTTAAVRVLTMLAYNATGMGHGAYVYVRPYGGTNGVTFTPGGSDTTDLATAPPGRVTKFQWDGAKSKWVADYVAPALFSANRLRNGTFVAWPGGTSGTIATGPTGSAAIAAAGWAVIPTGASVTWAQVTAGNNGAPQSLKVTGAASVTDVVIGQRIESVDAAPLAGQTCTFQAAIYNNTGGSITPTIATRYAGSADNWTSPVADLAATNLQACANGAWTIVSYTLAVHANAILGYEIKLDFGNNFSTNGKYVQISAADLRATPGATTGLSSSPPAPDLPDMATVLAKCARYQQTSYENGTAPGAATPVGMVGAATDYGQIGTTAAIFPVPMCATPTVSYWDGAGNASKCSYNASNSSAWVDNNAITFAPFNIGKRGFTFGTVNGVSASAYIHFRAYADFW